MNKKLAKWLGIATIAASLPLLAQQNFPRDPAEMVQMQVDRIDDQVKLTKDQRKQATNIFLDAQKANQEIMGQNRELSQSMAAAIKANDEAAMSKVAQDMGALNAKTVLNNAKAQAKFYAILTPAQQGKYTPTGGGYMGGRGGRGQGGAPPQE